MIVAIEALARDDFQHCDIVAVRALLLCRLGCVSDPIGAFAGVGDPSSRGGARSAVNLRRVAKLRLLPKMTSCSTATRWLSSPCCSAGIAAAGSNPSMPDLYVGEAVGGDDCETTRIPRSQSAHTTKTCGGRTAGAASPSSPQEQSRPHFRFPRDCRSAMRSTPDASCSSQSATRFATRLAAARQGTRHGVAVHVHPPWGRPIAQIAGTGRRSSTSTALSRHHDQPHVVEHRQVSAPPDHAVDERVTELGRQRIEMTRQAYRLQERATRQHPL